MKPIQMYSGIVYDGNLRNNNSGSDPNKLYAVGHRQSFQGFSGTSEFESFPLRQLFLNSHGSFPCEWDTGYLKKEDVERYVSEHTSKILVAHYEVDKSMSRCVLYIGGKDNLYVYLYNRHMYGKSSDAPQFGVCLLFSKKSKAVEKVMDYFISLVVEEKEEETGFINILAQSQSGFYLEKRNIPNPDIDFSLNYNQDFEEVHNLITEKLSEANSKGLVLLHGVPGTGKTTYIRYLINILKKRVIYIPPALANVISDPALIKFFISYPNSVLVIEDAENILMKRVATSSQAIANILNLTDGLLSDCTNIQVVATFNADILEIDEALLRKGRLIAKYEFGKLEEDRARKLAEKLGIEYKDTDTLANIYHAEAKSFIKAKSTVGFK